MDIGCQWVILGHSERRHVIGEDDQVSTIYTDATGLVVLSLVHLSMLLACNILKAPLRCMIAVDMQ